MCSSTGCQKKHWKQGHKDACKPASSPTPSATSSAEPLIERPQGAESQQQAGIVNEAASRPPIDIGGPQVIELPSLEPNAQEQAPLASHVIFPYDGYLALAQAPSTRVPLGMLNCGNRYAAVGHPVESTLPLLFVH